MKRSDATNYRLIGQAVFPAISGAFIAALFALIVAPESLFLSAMMGAIFGAVFGVFLVLGKDSLWTRIAGINSLIILATFIVALFALSIEINDVGLLPLILVIAGFLMALVASVIVTRPLRLLTAATQSIGEQDLDERVPVEGAREIRELAQSFNGMVEALQAAEIRRQQLLADVSHELRTPLTVLQSNLRAILDDVHDPDKEQIFTLYSQTRQLNHLVDDLHDIAHADADQLPLEKTEIDMIPLVEQAGELFEPLAQENGLTLQLSTPEKMPVLLGDRNRLIQMMQNLLANGLRHARSRVELRLWQDGEMACVEVADDGDGITAEHLPYIFDRFYRADPSRSRELGGSGLGLAIAEAIVEAHGGRITANSEGVGKGTTVRFVLPMTQQSS
ncbi:MAG TPA: ATP-binding protein [Patescibacteria group bacterium]|nr:ATP-binding protein [Patescibacteria group bacterium]